MDLLIEKLDGSRYYLSQYKVLVTDFEESAPSVTRNSKQLDQRNGSIDFGGWHKDKKINITGYYRADDMDEEEMLREKLYALLSDPNGYYITQLKATPSVAMERPGETSGNYYDKLSNYPSHKRFLVYTEAPEMELVGNVNGTLLYKLTVEFKTMKLPYGESVPRNFDVKPNVPYYGINLILNSSTPQVLRRPEDNPSYPSWVGRKIYIGLKNNETYTFSALVTSESTNPSANQWSLRIFKQNGKQVMLTNLDANTGARQSVTFTTPDDGISYDIWIYAGGAGVDYTPSDLKIVTTVSDYKLETGSVTTPYSLAPEDPEYNKWYLDTYYNTNSLFIPYSGTVPCNQLEQGFTIEMTAKSAASSLSFKIDDTELTSSNAVASGDVFMFSGFSYTKNGLSIVSKTNKAYFVLQPDKPNRITCNVPGTVRIIGFQNLYA